jgi:E3 ubiquitin-protein ligase RNF11
LFLQESNVPVFYPSPNVRRPLTQLTEEEQVKIAKRIGLIQHLPMGVFDDTTKSRE